MVVTLLAALVVSAPMPGDDESAHFKQYFEKGEALYGQKEYGMAVHLFRLADRRRVTPEVAYDLAKCHENLKDTPFALYYYRLYMKRAPQAPDTLNVADKVGKELSKLEGERKGFLELDASRATSITVAGKTYPEGPVAAFLPAGDYEISAQFPSGKKTMSVQVKAGKATMIDFEPVRPPMLALDMALPAEAVAKGVDSGAPGVSKTRIGAFAAWGLAALAVGTGAVFGSMSSADAAQVPNKKLSISQRQAFADSANQKGAVANTMFVVGGLAAVGGGVLFYMSLPEPGGTPGGATK